MKTLLALFLCAAAASAAPYCDAGQPQSFRVGGVGSLSAAASSGTAPLSYSWTQVSGPAVTITNATSATPSVSGFPSFGTYVFQLTVTDATTASATCQVRTGAVVTDANDVVISGIPMVETLLGPMIRLGANPWTWYDNRHLAEAALQISQQDTNYAVGSFPWIYGRSPGNYYDVVAAFYSLYYRSGIDTYRDAARTLADRWWTYDLLQQGNSCDVYAPMGMGNCWPARSLSVMGLVLRANDGRPEMWPGLRIIFNSYRWYLDVADPQWGMWETRDMAYHLAVVSYCALYDPDQTSRDNCKSSIAGSFATVWSPYRAADGSWPQIYYQAGSFDDGNSTVTLTNGSDQVTGVGTSWNADLFYCENGNGEPQQCQMWFMNSTAKPTSNLAGDSVAYKVTYIDGTHLQLDRPYEGSTGTHGWMLADRWATFVGFGVQPFIQGILGFAFDLAAKGIEDSYPTTAALAHSYNESVSNWIRIYGYRPAAKGMYYGVSTINCPKGQIQEGDPICTANYDYPGARFLNAEALRSIMSTVRYNGDATLRSFGDTLYSAMWSKPGTGSPNEDPYYISAYDDGGWYMAGDPPSRASHKYFGMGFGLGAGSSWPAIRLGGVGAPSNGIQTRRVNGKGKVIGGGKVH